MSSTVLRNKMIVLPSPGLNSKPVLVAEGPCLVKCKTYDQAFLVGGPDITPLQQGNPGEFIEADKQRSLLPGECLYAIGLTTHTPSAVMQVVTRTPRAWNRQKVSG